MIPLAGGLRALIEIEFEFAFVLRWIFVCPKDFKLKANTLSNRLIK